MDRKHCAGCRDDFYNGNNNLGVKECWVLKDAKLINRIKIHVDQPPPYKQKAEKKPNCYRAPRYVFVSPESLTKDGYWR
jgi:hypothetical protein